MNVDEPVDAYWHHYLLSRSSTHDDRRAAESFEWAYNWVQAVVSDDRVGDTPKVDPIELMIQLARRAPDDEALAHLGSGPLETYLDTATADIEQVDRAARRDARFRTALRCAWFDETLPDAAATRLRRFGPPS